MKRIIITIAAALMMGFFAANCNAQAITIEQPKAGEFVAKKNPYNGYTPTNNYYTHTDGVRYEIYTHTITRGDRKGQVVCYIRITSKKGNEYWNEIDVKPEELKK